MRPWWVEDPETDAEHTASAWLFRNDPEMAEECTSAPALREQARAFLAANRHAAYVEVGR